MTPLTPPLAVLVALAASPCVAAERPSFDCTTASTARELAVCTVPRLAAADRAMAAAWTTARRRLPPVTAKALGADQRAFLGRIDDGFDALLWGKAERPDRAGRLDRVNRAIAEGGGEIADLGERMAVRTAILAAIEPAPRGLAGVWIDHQTVLVLSAPENGRIAATWSTTTWGWPKYHCDFTASFRPEGARLVTDEVDNDEAGRRVTRIDLIRDGPLLKTVETTADDGGGDPDIGRACPRIPRLTDVLFALAPERIPADLEKRLGADR